MDNLNPIVESEIIKRSEPIEGSTAIDLLHMLFTL